jgi:hypothetical protein
MSVVGIQVISASFMSQNIHPVKVTAYYSFKKQIIDLSKKETDNRKVVRPPSQSCRSECQISNAKLG